MRKTLIEVFPGITPAKLITPELLQSTEVERLVFSEDRRTINAFFVFHRLVDKPVILSLEKAVNDRFFPARDTELKIRESYELSDYSLTDIVSLYRDSAVLDLTNEYPAFRSMFRRSEWTVRDDGRLLITFPDTALARSYEKEWASYLEKRFQQRFGIHAAPLFSFSTDNLLIDDLSQSMFLKQVSRK